ncbi:hypothetical protein ABT324_08790 [Saccharopolyspora sp. NPDC000359]|uniref:hypothetical protein n=1 Tax=Saccharopolyspora sp. NPDC000359 TaxID=3154251 RepID=UPI003328B189
MAKNPMMPFPMKGSGGAAKKVLGLLFVAALVVLVVKQPTESAQWVKDGWSVAMSAVDSVSTFLTGLAR